MSQINMNVTPEFEKELQIFMKSKGILTKSEAIRLALHEAVGRLNGKKTKIDFKNWLGLGLKANINKKPRFKSDSDLW